jgi:small subunit ribosomal protein S20
LANTKSARKRVRQQERRRDRNRAQRSRLKTALKRVMNAETPDEAVAAYRDTAAILDRFASRRLIHPNKARRKKSQLARRVAMLGGQP